VLKVCAKTLCWAFRGCSCYLPTSSSCFPAVAPPPEFDCTKSFAQTPAFRDTLKVNMLAVCASDAARVAFVWVSVVFFAGVFFFEVHVFFFRNGHQRASCLVCFDALWCLRVTLHHSRCLRTPHLSKQADPRFVELTWCWWSFFSQALMFFFSGLLLLTLKISRRSRRCGFLLFVPCLSVLFMRQLVL
jgi:hypothetical protein